MTMGKDRRDMRLFYNFYFDVQKRFQEKVFAKYIVFLESNMLAYLRQYNRHYLTDKLKEMGNIFEEAAVTSIPYYAMLVNKHLVRQLASMSENLACALAAFIVANDENERLFIHDLDAFAHSMIWSLIENFYNDISSKEAISFKMFDIWWAARTIQTRFRESISNPEYAMCKNRLLKEFDEFGTLNEHTSSQHVGAAKVSGQDYTL